MTDRCSLSPFLLCFLILQNKCSPFFKVTAPVLCQFLLTCSSLKTTAIPMVTSILTRHRQASICSCYPHGYEHPYKAVIGQHPPGSGVLYCMQLVYEVLMANKFTNGLVTLFSKCSHFS